MIYLIEFTKVVSARFQEYVKAAGTEQVSLYQDMGFRLIGYWETVPSQGYWPDVMSLWEMDDYTAYGQICAREYGQGPLGKRFRDWQRHLGALATSSQGHLLEPSSKTPTLEQIKRGGRRAPMCITETMRTLPGKSREYVEQLQKLWLPVAEKHGWWMVGSYYSPWRNREVFNIWGAEKWDIVPPGGYSTEWKDDAGDTHTWIEVGVALRETWDDSVMVALPFSPIS